MDWQKQAEEAVQRLTEEIKFYISEGVKKENAIKMVKKSTCIGPKYWQMVLSNVN